ncbi:hypothetical protein MMC18_003221 [Xylographa bjoerkii]|nr:hypothetical protein [Xylographa bjoerkii]
MFFFEPEFKAFASKVMPFVLAPAKPFLFDTETFSFHTDDQAVVSIRTIEVLLTHTTDMDRDPNMNGKKGSDDLTNSGIENVWASFLASLTKEVALCKDILNIEYGHGLPYDPTGVGEEAEVQAGAMEGHFIGIITWASEEV